MKTLTLLPLLFPLLLCAQKHDHHWISNYPFMLGPGMDIDFNDGPFSIDTGNISMPIRATNATMSDFDGNLLFYSNGIQVWNANNEMMENGDSLNWCGLTELNYGLGLNIPYLICLPAPSGDSIYYLVSARTEKDNSNPLLYPSKEILYAAIDVGAANGRGRVLEKDMPIGQAAMSAEHPNACRHGNGRDWWVLAGEDTASFYYRALLSPDGFSPLETQVIGYQPPFYLYYSDGGAQNLFSPDGAKFVDYDIFNGARIFDFDRCTGLLSNPVQVTFPDYLYLSGGAAISPSSRFLYVGSDTVIFQFDLWAADIAASIDTVAIWDGFYTPGTLNPTVFGTMQLMPDGRVYLLPGTSSPYYHYIANPDVKGDACNVVQHEAELPSRLVNIPTFPNYRLYDRQGSPYNVVLYLNGRPRAAARLMVAR